MGPEPDVPELRTSARVVVADDDPAIARLMGARLRNLGHAVEVVGDGVEALRAVEREAPDLLLCDIAMPGMDGLEVLTALRERDADLSIVMATAFGSERVAVDALRLGADDYLRKPFDGAEFDAVITRTLESRRLRRENTRLQAELNAKRIQLEKEIARAAAVQQLLLPPAAGPIPGWQIAGLCRPALEIGGDFYDWQIHEDNTLSFTLADVMGKGLGASLFMATVRAGLRSIANNLPIDEVVAALETALQADFDRTGVFVTMVHGRANLATGEIELIDAGHGLAATLSPDGTLRPIDGIADLPMGIADPAPRTVLRFTLAPGEALLLRSDGVEFDVEVEATIVGGKSNADAESFITALLDGTPEDPNHRDDRTLLILRRM